jgi:hypothetical protein
MKSRFPIYVRATAMVMLFAMFHYMMGYRLMYSLGILYAKEEAKECMVEKNNNIAKLTLSASDYNSLKWTEDNKEFSFNNEMYDVVSIQKTGNTYVINVYQDNKETQWAGSYHNFEKQIYHADQSSKGNKSAEEIMSAFQKEFTPVSEFTIHNSESTLVKIPVVAFMQHSLLLTDNIFHPPLSC